MEKLNDVICSAGSDRCPWIIQSRPGQRVNLTLYDFSRPMESEVVDGSNEACHVFAIIRHLKDGVAQVRRA